MHPEAPSPSETQAIDWIVRQRDPAFADWDGFAEWLARDADHAEIYDALASLDRDLDGLAGHASASPSPIVAAPGRHPMRRRAWFGAAVAATLVAFIAVPRLGLFADPHLIETAAGEHRSITLTDGSRIEINGASRVRLDDKRPRFARLERGEAMFHIVHRDRDPFMVEAGDARIVDLGTAFNVIRRDRETSVAVSEGVVLFNPDRDGVRINAGQGIDAADGAREPPRVVAIDVANVGGWRSGLLVYNGVPLPVVADDLKRTAGLKLTVAPEAAGLIFRGALVIDKDRARTVADLAALSGTRAERRGDGWVLIR